MNSSRSASYVAMLLRMRWKLMLLGCLRKNIKFVLLGPSVLMVFQKKKYG